MPQPTDTPHQTTPLTDAEVDIEVAELEIGDDKKLMALLLQRQEISDLTEV